MRALLALTIIVCFSPIPARAQDDQERVGGAFIERFQTFDQTRWLVSEGWPSEDLFSTEWRPSQVAQASQGLRLTLAATPQPGAHKPYMSGELRSVEEFRYGYFAARYRVVRGGGVVSAFFTFAPPTASGGQNEIDMEVAGNDTQQIELTYHVNGRHIREIVQLGFDASEDFHTYAFDWRADSIRWYVDNRLVHTSRDHVSELNRPQQIFASLWNSLRMPRWLGRFDPATAPSDMIITCIAHAPRRQRALC